MLFMVMSSLVCVCVCAGRLRIERCDRPLFVCAAALRSVRISLPPLPAVSARLSAGSHLTLIVIGKVTHDTARILVEMLEGGPTTVTLTRVQANARSILPPDQPSALRTPIADDDEAEVKQQREAEHKSDKQDGKKNKNNGSSSSSKDGIEVERVAGARVDEAGGPSVSVTEDLQPARPRIFKFSGLEENARYAVTIAGLAHAQPQSSFVTLIKDWKVRGNPHSNSAANSQHSQSIVANRADELRMCVRMLCVVCPGCCELPSDARCVGELQFAVGDSRAQGRADRPVGRSRRPHPARRDRLSHAHR